ncbi:MAG: hypothetical protein CL677_05995 [Bdellovibrionaceae bacterium]|nr:hypothetical protein [Pseudobdellovibrionaceae bacterium]
MKQLLITFKTIILLTFTFTLEAQANNYAQFSGPNPCYAQGYDYDPVIAGIERLRCLIPVAKDTVGDQTRLEVFNRLNRDVRSALRIITSPPVSTAKPESQVAINSVIDSFCAVETQMEELEEAVWRSELMDEILTAGTNILAVLRRSCQ